MRSYYSYLTLQQDTPCQVNNTASTSATRIIRRQLITRQCRQQQTTVEQYHDGTLTIWNDKVSE